MEDENAGRRVGDPPFNGPEAQCWESAIQCIPVVCKTPITQTHTADTLVFTLNDGFPTLRLWLLSLLGGQQFPLPGAQLTL